MDYGQMMGYPDAVTWVEVHAPDEDGKSQVLARMRYERDKTRPVKPKFSKGKYGKQYDSWICGNCGTWGLQVSWDFCPNCGYRIGWDNPRCLTAL